MRGLPMLRLGLMSEQSPVENMLFRQGDEDARRLAGSTVLRSRS